MRGRVQGVGFRASCAVRADALGVAGWARNRSDGSVELVASGDPAAVDALVAWCRQGPPLARVAGIEVTTVPEGTLAVHAADGFSVR